MSEMKALENVREQFSQRSAKFWNVVRKVENGKACSERDFDLKLLTPALNEVVKAHEIKRDPDVIIPTDNNLVDDVYEAALELYLRTGTYITDAQRYARFEEDEIKEALEQSPSQLTFGQATDASLLTTRTIEDRKTPFCMFGGGNLVSEDIYFDVLRSYAKEPLADTFSGGIQLNTVNGMMNRGRKPSEIYAAILTAILAREAAIDVGRPDIGLHNASNAESTAAVIAANRPEFGIRKTDGFLVASLPELKADYERLNKVAHLLSSGNIIGALYGPIVGTYGGPEGTAVITVANAIQNSLIFQPHYHLPFPFDMRSGCNTVPELLWLISVVGQAISRNTHLLMPMAGVLASGPCTHAVLYEAAAFSIVSTVSGLNVFAAEVGTDKYLDHCTGMESRMAALAGHATAKSGIKRKDTNELIKEVLKQYRDQIKHAPAGKSFRECYDLKTIEPSAEYVAIQNHVIQSLKDFGLGI